MNNFTATAISFFLLLLVLRREAPYSLCYFHCFSIEYLQAEQAGNEACPAKRCTRTLLNPLETSATDASPNVTRAECTAPAFVIRLPTHDFPGIRMVSPWCSFVFRARSCMRAITNWMMTTSSSKLRVLPQCLQR